MDRGTENIDSHLTGPHRPHRPHRQPHRTHFTQAQGDPPRAQIDQLPSLMPNPDIDQSFEDPHYLGHGASPAEEDSYEADPAEGEGGEEEDDEEGSDDGRSETSSAMFDQEADPEGWARRLDELAGVLEVGEVETRALKWGPPIERNAKGDLAVSQLPYDQFKELINHYLTSTEWKYSTPPGLFPTVQGRPDPLNTEYGGQVVGAMSFENHPIRVVGQDHMGARDVDREGHGQVARETGLGIEGLPVTR